MDYSKMSREELIRANQDLHFHLARLQGGANSDYKIKDSPIFKTSPNKEWTELFCSLAPDFTLTFLNEAFVEYFNIKREGFIGKKLMPMMKEEYRDKVSDIIRSLSPANPVVSFEYTQTYAGCEIRWLSWQVRALFDENDSLIEYHAVCQDITESKEAWEQLRHRLNIEHALTQISRVLVGCDEVDFNEILKTIGEALEVNRVYIFEFRENGRKTNKSWGWSDLHTRFDFEKFVNHDTKPFSWGFRQLQQNHSIIIVDRNSIAAEAQAERDLLDQQGIYATVMVPILGCDHELLACIGFDDTEKSRQWKTEDIKCLEMLAKMLASYWERRRMEKSLQAAEAQFRALADTAPAVIFVYSLSNLGNPLRYLNNSYPEISGYSREELLNKSWWDIIHPDYRELAKARAGSRLQGQMPPVRYEMPMLNKSGKIFWVDMAANMIEWAGETAVIGVIYDISDRKLMEEELRQARDELENRVIKRTAELVAVNEKLRREIIERQKIEQELTRSEANFRKLAETSPALIYVSQEDKFLYTNATCSAKTGYSREQLAAMNVWNFLRADYRELVRKNNLARQNGVNIPAYEVIINGQSGQEICGYIYADIIDYEGQQATLVMIVDITERKKMEEDLLQASKLESLGVLAGGIAHDFNNILTVISGNISLAKMIVDNENEVSEILNEVEQAAWQARDLTQQLLTFSKGGAPIKETASIQDLLRETASFVLRGSNVSCFHSIPDELWPVSIDRGQISQVINNLIINADQAMPEGGLIILFAENYSAVPGSSLPAGDYVKIGIIDAGTGIAPEDLPKIFDPYFSTKSKGHGLGLTSSYSIIKKHDGHIEVSSDIAVGTTVSIFLPALPEQMVYNRKMHQIPLAGQGKILIMDDEAIIRDTLGKMLKNLGYTTGTAVDGQQALQLYQQARQSNESYDAVVMDLTIAGGMGGKEAVKRLLEIDPGAKVIVSSGYYNDPVMSDFRSYGFCGVLPKPYQIQSVSQILYELLGEGHASQVV